MDTTDNIKIAFDAAGFFKDVFNINNAIRLIEGVSLGAGAGIVTSALTSKNPDLESLHRRDRFYKRKIEEMKNEQWLDDIITLKKKLESDRLDPKERKELESKYVSLINK